MLITLVRDTREETTKEDIQIGYPSNLWLGVRRLGIERSIPVLGGVGVACVRKGATFPATLGYFSSYAMLGRVHILITKSIDSSERKG